MDLWRYDPPSVGVLACCHCDYKVGVYIGVYILKKYNHTNTELPPTPHECHPIAPQGHSEPR